MQNSLRKAFVYRNVAGIIAETELIKIPLHVLTANPVVYAVDSTFAITAVHENPLTFAQTPCR